MPPSLPPCRSPVKRDYLVVLPAGDDFDASKCTGGSVLPCSRAAC